MLPLFSYKKFLTRGFEQQNNMALPAEFISSMQPLLLKEMQPFLAAITEDSPVSIRFNPFKHKCVTDDNLEQVPWSQHGYYLKNRPAFTFDPLFQAGYYYVQEASSMFVEYIVRELIHEPSVCLDSCAAPGGKSISILSALPEGSLLVSNEIVRSRANVLAENMTKFGHPNSVVTNNALNDFEKLPNFFDLILVDAPCSGEGMFRKDEVAVREWSPANVKMCCARQRDILGSVWDSLKPGGYLIYSTCTYNVEENEENAAWIADELGAEFVEIEVPSGWGIAPSLQKGVIAYRFLPHKTKGEGLFVSVLRKNDSEITFNKFFSKSQKRKDLVKDSSSSASLLQNPENFVFIQKNNILTAVPVVWGNEILQLESSLKTLSSGVELGGYKGKNFIPAHQLAMSVNLAIEAFPRAELTYQQALSYLRCEAISLDDAPAGFVLVTYKTIPLGFVKNLGNRANNLYPKEWRIRSGYNPENPAILFE